MPSLRDRCGSRRGAIDGRIARGSARILADLRRGLHLGKRAPMLLAVKGIVCAGLPEGLPPGLHPHGPRRLLRRRHPWTIEGNAIDARDLLNPPIQSETTDWTLEAEWNPDGAYCVDDIRQQTWKTQGEWPACFLKNGKPGKYIKKNNCGSLKNERALMYSTFDLEAQQNKPL